MKRPPCISGMLLVANTYSKGELSTVTNESISLIDLAEKHADADFMREMGEWALHRLMELEVESQIGAGRHERSDTREAHRNGYRERSLETRVGTMNLKIPKLRSGSYYPSFLEPRRRSEQALVSVIQEAYVKGVSTRKVVSTPVNLFRISPMKLFRFWALKEVNDSRF